MAIKIIDGTTWPNPLGERFNEINYKARYARESLTKSDELYVAQVMEAYSSLLTHPMFTLEKVKSKVSMIRKELELI